MLHPVDDTALNELEAVAGIGDGTVAFWGRSEKRR